MGPYGPSWAHMGPILFRKSLILIKNYKIINKSIQIVNLEILKVKTWFGDKDLFSSICLVKQMILQKIINLLSKTGVGGSGHVRFQTFGPIWHVSGPKMVF